MASRIYNRILQEYLYQYPCVLISGPRQAGKSVLIESVLSGINRSYEYLHLEKDEDADKLSNPARYFLHRKERLFVIDAVQRMPSLLKQLRELLLTPGPGPRFLVVGTITDQLTLLQRQLGPSLCIHLAMSNLHCLEIGEVADPMMHWFAGGFPIPLQMQDPELRPVWFASYLRSMADRDLPLAGLHEHPEMVRRILPFLAEATGEELNKAHINKQLGLRPEILNKVLSSLENIGIIRRLDAFSSGTDKRVVRSPRYYFTDTGLLHHLLAIRSPEQLLVSAYASASWTNYVINQVAAAAFPPLRLYFYRTHDGAGADLVVFKGKKPICCVIADRADAPAIRRGFTTAIRDFGTKINFIVKPGGACDVPLRHNIRHTDATALCKRVEEMRLLKLRKVYVPSKTENPEDHF